MCPKVVLASADLFVRTTGLGALVETNMFVISLGTPELVIFLDSDICLGEFDRGEFLGEFEFLELPSPNPSLFNVSDRGVTFGDEEDLSDSDSDNILTRSDSVTVLI